MMTIDQAKAEASQRWCKARHTQPQAWITASGRRAVGFDDGEFRYAMGIGETWELAFANADTKEPTL